MSSSFEDAMKKNVCSEDERKKALWLLMYDLKRGNSFIFVFYTNTVHNSQAKVHSSTCTRDVAWHGILVKTTKVKVIIYTLLGT